MPVGCRFNETYITEVQTSVRFTVIVWGRISVICSGCHIRIEARNNADRYIEMLEISCVPSFMERFPMAASCKSMTDRRSTLLAERQRRWSGSGENTDFG